MWSRLVLALLLCCFISAQARLSLHRHGAAHPSHSLHHGSLSRRDDYSCSASNPCSNGACCGGDGFCGYGPTYCGDGCISNCDATAECGQYAEPANTTCPLNTWYIDTNLVDTI
ncbi:hypothetical protein BDV09DRAFT_31383 [Aspergillus tetrazonus]